MIDSKKITSSKDFWNLYPLIDIEDIEEIIGYQKCGISDNKLKVTLDSFEKELRNIILNSHPVQRMDGKGRFIIRSLFKAYLTNPQQLPDKTIISIFRMYEPRKITKRKIDNGAEVTELVGSLRNRVNEHIDDIRFKQILLRVICDYISGMTDAYALKEYKDLYS